MKTLSNKSGLMGLIGVFCWIVGVAQAQLLKEIMVTAQKREQANNDVSL